jgi:hypothetical protein
MAEGFAVFKREDRKDREGERKDAGARGRKGTSPEFLKISWNKWNSVGARRTYVLNGLLSFQRLPGEGAEQGTRGRVRSPIQMLSSKCQRTADM